MRLVMYVIYVLHLMKKYHCYKENRSYPTYIQTKYDHDQLFT